VVLARLSWGLEDDLDPACLEILSYMYRELIVFEEGLMCGSCLAELCFIGPVMAAFNCELFDILFNLARDHFNSFDGLLRDIAVALD